MPGIPPIAPSFSEDPVFHHPPLLPTLTFASFKGGVWKTSLAVASAERLAHAGFRVLLLTCDQQEDARYRLGVKHTDGDTPRLPRGPHGGAITVISAHRSKIMNVLYNPPGPARFQHAANEPFQVAVVDTPPEKEGGGFPGVFMVTPLDGTDAARNADEMFDTTPLSTEVLLVRVKGLPGDEDEWKTTANKIEGKCLKRAPKRRISHMERPIPQAKPVRDTLDNLQSVWSIPRRNNTLVFLASVEQIVQVFLDRNFKDYKLPPMTARQASNQPDRVTSPWGED